jgi:hypothetical protein
MPERTIGATSEEEGLASGSYPLLAMLSGIDAKLRDRGVRILPAAIDFDDPQLHPLCFDGR